jgi:hypothetical protein
MKLKEIKKDYPVDSWFFSATGKIKRPLKVTELRYANHEERFDRIKELENIILKNYTNNTGMYVNYNKIVFKYSFAKKMLKELKERKYLLYLKRDIVEANGGVIYCGETNTLAKTFIK